MLRWVFALKVGQKTACPTAFDLQCFVASDVLHQVATRRHALSCQSRLRPLLLRYTPHVHSTFLHLGWAELPNVFPHTRCVLDCATTCLSHRRSDGITSRRCLGWCYYYGRGSRAAARIVRNFHAPLVRWVFSVCVRLELMMWLGRECVCVIWGVCVCFIFLFYTCLGEFFFILHLPG